MQLHSSQSTVRNPVPGSCPDLMRRTENALLSILQAAGAFTQQGIYGSELSVLVLQTWNDPGVEHPEVGAIDPIACARAAFIRLPNPPLE